MSEQEYLQLVELLSKARDDIAASPEWCEPTALGALTEMDDRALSDASQVAHRLWLNRKYPRSSDSRGYLPELPAVTPESIRA